MKNDELSFLINNIKSGLNLIVLMKVEQNDVMSP